MSSKTLFASILCGLIAIAVRPMSAATPTLAGSWQFSLTAATPSASTTPATEIPGLATFTADGSAIETDGSEFAPSVSSATAEAIKATPGHGIWQLANTPATLFVKYVSLLLDVNGALYGENLTTMFLTIDATTGTTFKGSYTTVQTVGTLTKILSTGTVTGILIPHVPLP